MKNAIVVSLATLLPVLARATEEVSCARFPDADAVVINETENVTYNPDGTYENLSECWTKILTEKGRRDESSLSLTYSKRYGEAKILYVGAIDTNGVERAIDVTATTKDSTDNSSMSANIYDPLDRLLVCTIPGLKVGETTHVKLLRKTFKARCEGKWSDLSVQEWTHPILRSVYEVRSPAALPLKKISVRHPLGNVTRSTRTLDDGSAVHTFVCTNSPQCFPEPDMPQLYTQVQHIRVSTAESWPEISRWYWDLCAPHISKTNAAMVAKVGELVAAFGGAAALRGDENELLRAVFKFVSQEVRYMGLTMEDTSPGYAPHDVDVTFDNRYGVCRDKAGLLVAMLRLAGFKAFPVLIHAGAKLDPEVPQPFFNHAIVAVERPKGTGADRYVLMDPTNENAKDIFPAYLNDKSFLVARPEGEELLTAPIPSPEANTLDIVSKGSLAKDGSVFLETEFAFGGINDTIYRQGLVRKTPEDRVKFFERVVKGLAAGAELVSCRVEPKDMLDTESPVRIRLSARFPEMVLAGETRDELNVPYFGRALGMANFLLQGNTSLEKRKFPLVLDTTARVRETVTVDLAGTVGPVLELPPDARTSGPIDYVRAVGVTNGVLSARRAFTVAEVEIAPDAYADVRETMKRIEASERRRPVFAKDPCAEADVRWSLEATETDIASERAWTVTNTVVREILTYAGKKSSAELKLSYNPAVESLTVVSAVVSNRDGRVMRVTPKEMNEMDCGWAASAPRYPASKLLVVNLPSVEIGSVISLTTVHTVTNAAASYYGVYGFDSHDPLDRRFVRIGNWTREVVNPRRLPREAGQPENSLWRDQIIVSSNDFSRAARRYRAADASAAGGDVEDALESILAGAKDVSGVRRVKAVRDWMAKHVRVSGPSLYEVPLDLQLTDPSVVLKERYASRIDYIRTMCALLRAAGFTADVVLSAANAGDPVSLRERIRFEKPNVRAFASALCRVTVREGGFLWFGGTRRTYFIGTESEYAEMGATAHDGSDYFDPVRGTFGIVTVPDKTLANAECERTEIDVRENGGVDMIVESSIFGSGVGPFRKKYAEILPEDRNRLHQSILGAVAQAATATGDLEADFTGYPATRRFTCFVPDYATVAGDAITLQIPAMVSSIPAFTGKNRKTPFAIGASGSSVETVVVRFPEGYAEVEHLPEAFEFRDPKTNRLWLTSVVGSEVKDGVLTVTLRREVCWRPYAWYDRDMIELVNDRSRIASSRANRTIVVRATR